MYNAIHDAKEASIQQLAVQINQIHRALQIEGLSVKTREALELDMEDLLKRYHRTTGQYFFFQPRTKVVRFG